MIDDRPIVRVADPDHDRTPRDTAADSCTLCRTVRVHFGDESWPLALAAADPKWGRVDVVGFDYPGSGPHLCVIYGTPAREPRLPALPRLFVPLGYVWRPAMVPYLQQRWIFDEPRPEWLEP